MARLHLAACIPSPLLLARRDRLLYTLVCLAIFLVCSQLPLYGVKTTSGADPLYWARVIMASSRGTVGAGHNPPPPWPRLPAFLRSVLACTPGIPLRPSCGDIFSSH